MANDVTWFVLSLLLTVALVVLTYLSGWRGRRRRHLTLAPTLVVSLLLTIYAAERLARSYVFDDLRRSIHLPIAIVAALLWLGPVLTGLLRLWRDSQRKRRWHRLSVHVALALMALATLTGLWMVASGQPGVDLPAQTILVD